jgi:hypothetical protein
VLLVKTLVSHETAESKSARQSDDWNPDWINYNFTAWAQCSNQTCKQSFAIGGEGGVGPDYGPEGDIEWQDYFAPLFCRPMPDIIGLPEKCPLEVQTELRSAFSIFWLQKAGCAGRIRVALEYLMNHLGVPKRKRDKAGKYFDLTLHARIDAYAKSEPDIGAQLIALKWLGNTGSHYSDVKASDLLDAFEILEHALAEIVGGRSKRIALLAKKLTRKHGR